MEKYIAFGLYRKNDQGGHQSARDFPRDGDEVYIASEVEALRKLAGDMLEALEKGVAINPTSFFHEELKSLMGS